MERRSSEMLRTSCAVAVWLVWSAMMCCGYESRYDAIGPEALIYNTRLYRKYFECIAKDGKCTPDAKFIKDVIGDAMPSLCIRCTAKQRYFADTLLAFLFKNKTEDFRILEAKYDPQGLFRKDLKKRKKI